MLQFIVGRAGTGKTTKLMEMVKDSIAKGEKVILIVPEQYSFETERRLYKTLGAGSSLLLEVLSFTRLCNNIFRKFGGLAGVQLNDISRYLLMSVAVEELKDQLNTYKKSANNVSFLESLLAVCKEFKTAGIGHQQLEEYLKAMPTGGLKSKMTDLSIIYSTYQTLINNGYLDSEDDIVRATETLENNNYFEEYAVFIDGFTTFMAGEFELLSHIIRQSQKTVVTFTTGKLEEKEDDYSVFSVVNKAANKLGELACGAGVEVLEPIVLKKPLRYKNQELELISSGFLQPTEEVYDSETEFVKLYKAQDSYSEVQMIGAEIARLVRTGKTRYREIGVIARDPEEYKENIKIVFDRYGIPYYADEKMKSEQSPVFSGILAALESVQSNYDSEAILLLAKSPIMGLDPYSVSLLENYCYSWQVKGAIWGEDFVNNPRGMVEQPLPKDKEILEIINAARVKLVVPLEKLKQSIASGGGKSFAVGIYNFLIEVETRENLKSFASQMNDFEAESFLKLCSQFWDNLMDILDIFGEILGSINISRNRITELFRLAVSSGEVGIIPQTLDQVLVGGADRVRPEQLKVVFIIGANEGIFPKPSSNKGVLTQSERKKLIDTGLEIGGESTYAASLERFYAYFAFGLPSERLFVSYSEADLKGQKLLPSVLVTQLLQQFPSCTQQKPKPEEMIESENSALELLAENYREDNTLRATLYELFKGSRPELIERMNSSAWKPVHRLANSANIRELFGANMRLSPSRVERFYRCPFAYFAQDGLKIAKRQQVEFSPLESGSVIHHVLQVMMTRHGGKGLTKLSSKELTGEISGIILEYLESRVDDVTKLPTRLRFLFNRLCSTLARLLEHIGREFLQSLYEPAAYELAIGQNEETKPIELETPDGIKVSVSGFIDRVDIMEKDGKKFVRVVDYKSGRKSFRLSDVLYGLNLQMLLYLFTVQEHGTGALAGGIPAGVLYMPVRESYTSVERNLNEKKAEQELRKQWKMNGILLKDEDMLRGMEEDLAGVFIPAKLKQNGEFDAASSLASNEELGILSREVKDQIKNMITALSTGHIGSFPVNSPDYPTCSYCDYREVCGYEEGDPERVISQMSTREVFEFLEEKEKQDV